MLGNHNYPGGLNKAPDATLLPCLAGGERKDAEAGAIARAAPAMNFIGSGQRHIIDWKSSHFLTIHKKDSLFFSPFARQTNERESQPPNWLLL